MSNAKSEKTKISIKFVVPFTCLIILFACILFAFFYYGYGYYGMIIVGSLGSVVVLIMLVKTKHKLQDEFNLYSHTGPFLLQTECTAQDDTKSLFSGNLFVYENGFIVDCGQLSLYVDYNEITSAKSLDNECISVTYNDTSNHILRFYIDNKLKMKAILNEFLSRITVYDDMTESSDLDVDIKASVG